MQAINLLLCMNEINASGKTSQNQFYLILRKILFFKILNKILRFCVLLFFPPRPVFINKFLMDRRKKSKLGWLSQPYHYAPKATLKQGFHRQTSFCAAKTRPRPAFKATSATVFGFSGWQKTAATGVATAAGRGWRRGRGKWRRGNTGQRFRPAAPY